MLRLVRVTALAVLGLAGCATAVSPSDSAAPRACHTNADCGPDHVCVTHTCGRPPFCVFSLAVGACTSDYVPVCGCDGHTYTNDCTSLHSGVEPMTRDGAVLFEPCE